MTGAAYSNPDLGENSERAAREGPRADIPALRMECRLSYITLHSCYSIDVRLAVKK